MSQDCVNERSATKYVSVSVSLTVSVWSEMLVPSCPDYPVYILQSPK